MPEKPKRRKNKNKRKNKNIRAENNKSNNEVAEHENEESCSTYIEPDNRESCSTHEDNENSPKCQDNSENMLNENSVNECVMDETPSTPDIACNTIESVNEDFNNNSSTEAVQTLQVPLPSESNLVEENALQECTTYIVESPEQPLKGNKPKLNNAVKSKSLDNDEVTKIVDITEDITSNVTPIEEDSTLGIVDTSNILVSDVESDIEWENTDMLPSMKVPSLCDIATSALTITTLPLNVAHCQQIDVSLTPDVETSLRNYLRTLNLSTHPENIDSIEIKAEIEQIINREVKHRLRRKGLADDFGLQRLGPPRTLDVIDEEGSGESSKSSRRQSYLNDKKCDIDDLEDDVFEDKNKVQEKIARKSEAIYHKQTLGRLVPQECMLVGAKIKEPEVTEARGNWTLETVEKMTGAEVVYLTDSSSSTSSLHDNGDETDDGMDTDVSIRMITPTIEVTDTENLLKNTFLSQSNVESKSGTSKDSNSNEHIIEVKYEGRENQKCPETEENSSKNHEIIVLTTDNIHTNLYVKDLESNENQDYKNNQNIEKPAETNNIKDIIQGNSAKYDLEIKVLKCELNDAINNLIKEVSDSEISENKNEALTRQDSSSSICSSQCTAKYNPTSSSLNDVSNILHDETLSTTKIKTVNNENISLGSHVKDVFEHVTGATAGYKNKPVLHTEEPLLLRDLCVRKIASFPYGDKILEELASVSKRLQNITGAFTTESTVTDEIFDKERMDNKMPYYPLPDVSLIDKVILPTKVNKEPVPPPLQPRNSSLKKKSRDEEVWTGIPTKIEPVYVCLSPSQKMLMEKTQTVMTKEDASELADMHKKYVDRRGYNEQYTKGNQKDDSGNDVSPVVPFKSQTGSRLLALICDPSVTGNINTNAKHKSLDQLEKKFTLSSITSLKHRNNFESSSNTFKPIPPPRPKKLASSFYESDESSDFTDSSLRSMKSERKFFHFSTGNLNKEIEDDISSIQNMHRYCSNTRDNLKDSPRRPSLPQDICDQQMEYIRRKEKEIDAEIQRLESLKNTLPSSIQKMGPKAPLISEKEVIDENVKDSNNYFVSKRRNFFSSLSTPEKRENISTNKHDNKGNGKLSSLFSSSQEELLREKMYTEYVTQMAEREERKQHKVIKITNTPVLNSSKISKSLSSIDMLDSKINNRIEKEFISKARERWDKLGIKDPETEDEREPNKQVYREPKVIEHKIKVIESGQEKEVKNLPSHLQEFVSFTVKDKEPRIDDTGESKSDPASPHVVIWCAVMVIVLAVTKYFLRLLRSI